MKYLFVLSRRFILTLTMCMSFLAIFSQEHMTFQGIPIDGTIKVFTKQMKKHGFKVERRVENGYAYRGHYITVNDLIHVPLTSNSKTVNMVVITVNFPDMRDTKSWMVIKENYDYVVNLFSKKYDTAEKESIANFEAPYEEGDGNEVEGIINDKCHYSTDFHLPQGIITVEIESISEGLMTHSQIPEDYDKKIPNITISIIDKAFYKTKDIQL